MIYTRTNQNHMQESKTHAQTDIKRSLHNIRKYLWPRGVITFTVCQLVTDSNRQL